MDAIIDNNLITDYILNQPLDQNLDKIYEAVNGDYINKLNESFSIIKTYFRANPKCCRDIPYQSIDACFDMAIAFSQIKRLFSLIIDFDYFKNMFGDTDYILYDDIEYKTITNTLLHITDIYYFKNNLSEDQNKALCQCCEDYNLLCNLFGVLGLSYSDGKYLCINYIDLITDVLRRLNYILDKTKFMLYPISKKTYKSCMMSSINSYLQNMLYKNNISFAVS